MTAQLAVEVKHLPHWEVNWSDASPQRDTATLTISDILPTKSDGLILEEQWSSSCKSLHHLGPLIPPKEGHNIEKLSVVPMKLLFLERSTRQKS